MDNQEQQAAVASQTTTTPPAVNLPPQSGIVPQPAKPELVISDSAAAALLTVNNLQANSYPKQKLPTKMIIAIIGLIILVIAVSVGTGLFKSKAASNLSGQAGTAGQQSQSTSRTSKDDTSNQINKDVKACSDPVQAMSVC